MPALDATPTRRSSRLLEVKAAVAEMRRRSLRGAGDDEVTAAPTTPPMCEQSSRSKEPLSTPPKKTRASTAKPVVTPPKKTRDRLLELVGVGSPKRAAPKRKQEMGNDDFDEDYVDSSDDDSKESISTPPKKTRGRPPKPVGVGSAKRAAPKRKQETSTPPKNIRGPYKKRIGVESPKKAAPKRIQVDRDEDGDGPEVKRRKKTHRPPPPPYPDPAGMNPGDLAVETIVHAQVTKVLSLLRDAVSSGDLPKEIRIGTACSGTDSPVLGSILDMEALKAAGHEGLLKFSHVMSCEIEPFKQAFLARNYPGAVLLPDIRELVPEDGSRKTANVTGSLVDVPSCDIFVAGTVCKDFSGRKTKYRLDLEDQGKSGQTFFAAVAYIFDRQIKMSIFENVRTSPWEKMQEYITGVLSLSSLGKESSGGKKVKSLKTGGAEDEELIFLVGKQGCLEVVAVPRNAGVRVGALLCQVRPAKGPDRPARLPQNSKLKAGEEVPLHRLRRELTLQEGDSLVFDTQEHGYFTHVIKVDSKFYGLPQTRQRGYMFVWHKSEGGSELGPLWEELVRFMQHPVRYSLPNFLLPDDDERVRRFRDVLRGPLGRRAQQTNAAEWKGDWWESNCKDAQRAKDYHTVIGQEPDRRPITGWGRDGLRKGHPSLWPEMLSIFDSRQCDLIEAFAAECADEEHPRDPLHSSYVWDISQNVGITPSYSKPGCTGCITPGGWLLIPDRGRCMLGYEKLIVQGIPAGRMALGMESEVQLSDLAGNAMSLPVVNSCLLAAIAVKALARQRGQGTNPLIAPQDAQLPPPVPRSLALSPFSSSQAVVGKKASAHGQGAFFQALAKLCREAEASSILCRCETSGSISAAEVLHCVGCGLSLCRNCAELVATASHEENLEVRPLLGKRSPPGSFARKLRQAAPQRLSFSGPEELAMGATELILADVRREEGRWSLRFLCERKPPTAELRLFVGQMARGKSQWGLRGELRLFTDASRSSCGAVSASARLMFPVGGADKLPVWEIRGPAVPLELHITGSQPEPSYRAEAGLEERKREKWPAALEVKGHTSLSGTYKRLTCRGTAVQGALWSLEGVSESNFLYFRPDVDRTGPDIPTLAASPSYHDAEAFTHAVLDTDWKPSFGGKRVQSTLLSWKKASSLTFVQLEDKVRAVRAASKDLAAASTLQKSLDTAELVKLHGISEATMSSLAVVSKEWVELAPRGAGTAQHFSQATAGVLLRDGIPAHMQDWQPLSSDLDWGTCELSVPQPPGERWNADGLRCYDHAESVDFELKMKQRPTAWRVRLRQRKQASSGEAEVAVRPIAAAHRAAVALPRSSPSAIRCEWRVVEPSQELESMPGAFRVPNSDAFALTETPKAMRAQGKELYPRQCRALRRMLDIEAGLVSFEQEERWEGALDGVGWLLEARATASRKLPGGVLADQMGGGKTVTTLALVASEKENVESQRSVHWSAPVKQQSKATLILCPSSLVGQWNTERINFTGEALQTVVIESARDLETVTVADLLEADLVIVTFELLASEEYLQNLRNKSRSEELPDFPGQVGHKEPEQLRGIWIPGHPAQPYGTAKGKQQLRELAAFFSARYGEAVAKLRQWELKAETRNPPLEYFEWHRVVIDEVHYAFGDFGGGKENKAHRAAREMLGVTQSQVKLRPLRAAAGIWGLTGTPMLSNEERVTEMAALCGGVYVMSARRHWRTLERASVRDQFLLAQEPAVSMLYRTESRRHAQRYVSTAFQRNCVDSFQLKRLSIEMVPARLGPIEAEQYLINFGGGRDFAPKRSGRGSVRISDPMWRAVLELTATSAARRAALQQVIRDVRLREGEATKVVVFAESGSAMAAARTALTALPAADGSVSFAEIIEEEDDPSRSSPSVSAASQVAAFARPDVTEADRRSPRVLLLSFDQAAGLNLQYSCHNAVLFAPLWGSDPVAACAQEQQAIGRVHRPGQQQDVNIYRIELRGPEGQATVDAECLARNKDEKLIAAATSN
ncbi:unnamed protein product [Polarella glacialis]|uniref:Helicase ATP-binding domain-containing protein n=1 Tax=Polarella glacialis TaxID=89957 RepID=A0A813E480_POLGL|nr:unnamed protein product [Polarella glacialis]